MADESLVEAFTAKDPDADLKEMLNKPDSFIFVRNEEIERGDSKLARLIVLIKVKTENNPDVTFKTTETSTGVLIEWSTNTSKKRAPGS